MNSEYEHADPDFKDLTIQVNGTYANLITMLLPAMLGIVNEHKAIVFIDKDGDPHKTMQDSTGDGTIPVNSVIFANSDGRATFNSGFKFDATNALIQFPLPFTLAFGDQETNGSMRIRITDAGFWFGKRINGAWSETSIEV
jgi:hypothetical protein